MKVIQSPADECEQSEEESTACYQYDQQTLINTLPGYTATAHTVLDQSMVININH